MKAVTIETAKLAKEKGFNEYCWEWFYITANSVHKEITSHSYISYKPNNKELEEYNEKNCNYISAPYQCQLADWLREKHDIFIEIGFDDLDWGYIIQSTILDEDYNVNVLKDLSGIKSYEDCFETALQEALKLI